MGERLSPIGFWSYARQDDEEKLSQLRVRLSRQLQQQYGRNPIKIFQDVAAIPPGAEWEAKILDALNTSTFFIPIITPNFLESEWCNKEFFAFREREKQLVKDHPELTGHRRIFPIYYVDIEGVKPHDPALLGELRRLQWLDFQDLIYKDDGREEVQSRLGELARSLRQLLHLELRTTESGQPSEPFPSENAPAEAPPVLARDEPAVTPPPRSEPLPEPPRNGWAPSRRTWLPWTVGLVVAAVLVPIIITPLLTTPKTEPKPAVDKASAAPKADGDPRLAAAKLMVGRWSDSAGPAGCRGPDVVEITLAPNAPDGSPRLQLDKDRIGTLNPDNSWLMDGGLWRYRNGRAETRAVDSPTDKFDPLIACPPKDSTP